MVSRSSSFSRFSRSICDFDLFSSFTLVDLSSSSAWSAETRSDCSSSTFFLIVDSSRRFSDASLSSTPLLTWAAKSACCFSRALPFSLSSPSMRSYFFFSRANSSLYFFLISVSSRR